MAEQNEQCGGLCASPALIAIALAAAIVLPVGGYFVAKLLGGKPADDLGEEAVLRRIQPMAQIALAASSGAGGGAPKSSEEIYKSVCSACHDAGVAGAPKLGDKAAWAPRIAQGADTLHKHALQGFQGKTGVMPARGGWANLSDAEVAAAVDYMVSQAR